jgi:phosphoribosylformylglycinamidine cyclo-ligase
LFSALQKLGNVDEDEMYRAFNMGIGMVFIVDKNSIKNIRDALESITQVYEIGEVIEGKNIVFYD